MSSLFSRDIVAQQGNNLSRLCACIAAAGRARLGEKFGVATRRLRARRVGVIYAIHNVAQGLSSNNRLPDVVNSPLGRFLRASSSTLAPSVSWRAREDLFLQLFRVRSFRVTGG